MSRFRCYDEHDEPSNNMKNNCNDNHLPSSGVQTRKLIFVQPPASHRPTDRTVSSIRLFYRNVFNVPKECYFHFWCRCVCFVCSKRTCAMCREHFINFVSLSVCSFRCGRAMSTFQINAIAYVRSDKPEEKNKQNLNTCSNQRRQPPSHRTTSYLCLRVCR